MVERLEFHPDGDWLLAAGGYTDGFLLFCDPAGKKVLAQAKAPMYVHDFALNEGDGKLYAVGHHKIAVLQLGGSTKSTRALILTILRIASIPSCGLTWTRFPAMGYDRGYMDVRPQGLLSRR